MTIKIPKIIGHRGAAGYAPENTLESISTAADMGVEWVEFDVKLTQDDVPILFHDETLDRTTNGSGLVAKTTYEDIQNLEAGSWFGDSFAGVKIPTLEEAVDLLIELDLGLNLEIKPCPGREKETAEVILDQMSQIWDDHARITISSFQHVSLEVARDMANDWARGYLFHADEGGKTPENWRDMADYLDVKTINPHYPLATKELVSQAHDDGYKVLVYTLNDPLEAPRLQANGVDTIITDVPDIIEENLLSVH